MNDNQLKLYRYLWADARRALIANGMEPKRAEVMRQRIHLECGAVWDTSGKIEPKSSTVLNNADFDKIKARFLAISNGSDLLAQLEQIDMPAKRIRHAAAALLDAIGIDADPDRRDAYLAGVARKPLEDCDDDDLQRILVSLNHTRLHRQGVAHNHPRAGKGAQSRYAHRVGHRSAQPAAAETAPASRIRDQQAEIPF